MDLKVSINQDSKKKEEIEKCLRENLPVFKKVEVVDGMNILDIFTLKQVKKMMAVLYEAKLDGEIEAIFCLEKNNPQSKKLVFDYSDSYKKIFLFSLSQKWENKNGVARAIKVLYEIQPFEKKFGYDLLYFTPSQIEETVQYLFQDTKFYRLKFRINVFKMYGDFWVNDFPIDPDQPITWHSAFELANIRELLKDVQTNNLIKKEDLFTVAKNVPNLQDALLPIMIFEGIKFAEDEQVDEARKVQKKHLRMSEIISPMWEKYIHLNREIMIDQEVYCLLKNGSEQRRAIKQIRFTTKITEYMVNDYVLRPLDIAAAYKRSLNQIPVGQLTYRGAYARLKMFQNTAESLAMEQDFTVQNIVKSGKIHYIHQYIMRGEEKYDAVRKTLIRFGDWHVLGDYSEEKKYPNNRQLVNRLAREYDILMNE